MYSFRHVLDVRGKPVPARNIERWMLTNAEHHIDHRTNEVNATSLAEAAADDMDLYTNTVTYDIPDEVFEVSAVVAQQIERNLSQRAASRQAATADDIADALGRIADALEGDPSEERAVTSEFEKFDEPKMVTVEASEKTAKAECKECGAEIPGFINALCRDCKNALYLQRLRYADDDEVVEEGDKQAGPADEEWERGFHLSADGDEAAAHWESAFASLRSAKWTPVLASLYIDQLNVLADEAEHQWGDHGMTASEGHRVAFEIDALIEDIKVQAFGKEAVLSESQD